MPIKINYHQLEQELISMLTRRGPMGAPAIASALKISQPTFSRLFQRVAGQVLTWKEQRRTMYAAKRAIRGVGTSVSIFEIDEKGSSRHFAQLHGIKPAGFYLEGRGKDIPSGVFDDLPWFLNDLRPAGFLGRLVPRRHPELDLPGDVQRWTADHCLLYLSRYGWNPSGNFVVGEEAFGLHVQRANQHVDHVKMNQRKIRYPRLAENVLEQGEPGSSAAGEMPKFLVTRIPGEVAVLVKFSPPLEDRTSRRLGDLLVCEHLALQILKKHKQPAAKSEIIEGENRIFLEVERFDRLAGAGRRGLISLMALDAEFVGGTGNWGESTRELHGLGKLGPEHLETIQWLQCFGKLIANSDMHSGNLSFMSRGLKILGVAPAYDMLPMLYAPRDGNFFNQSFEPPTPGAEDAAVWGGAHLAAVEFWRWVAAHELVSKEFKKIARANLKTVDSLEGLGRMLPGKF